MVIGMLAHVGDGEDKGKRVFSSSSSPKCMSEGQQVIVRNWREIAKWRLLWCGDECGGVEGEVDISSGNGVSA
eukprot:13024523-Ditylum_brightwellii.AAC.1